MSALGPIGRLGRWSATHVRLVVVAWASSWPSASASSRRASRPPCRAPAGRTRARSRSRPVTSSSATSRATSRGADGRRPLPRPDRRRPRLRGGVTRTQALLRDDARVAAVTPPRAGLSISADGHTAIVMAGAAADPMRMVPAADELKGSCRAAAGRRRAGQPHRGVGHVVRLQRREPRRDDALRADQLAGDAGRSWCWPSAPWSRPACR